MSLGGRPKEQGGHKPLKISVEKFVYDGLQKVGNKSQFLEGVARPVLEKMDPGEASTFLWKIDVYLSQGIIKASKEGNFSQVQALGWLASQLEDARKLCGIPEKAEEAYPGKRSSEVEGKPSEVNPYQYLNEKERQLYRLDIKLLSLKKQMADPSDPKMVEWIKREEEELRRKWGLLTP